MDKITVIDAPCGAGKSSWAIQEMNNNPEQKYIYCTPFLDEIERIRDNCGRSRFREPVNFDSSKIESFNELLAKGESIAVTHSTFLNATQETLQLIHEGEYSLILDEVLDVLTEFNDVQTVKDTPRQSVSTQDIEWLLGENIIEVGADYKVHWRGGHYGAGDNFKFAAVEKYAKLGRLYCVRRQFLLTIFPPEMFGKFEKVYVLTYLFPGSLLDCYFKMYKIGCQRASVYNGDGVYSIGNYSTAADMAFRKKCRELVDVYVGDLNKAKRTLSKAWYKRATDDILKQLKNDVYTYFHRRLRVKASDGDIMWTCPSDYERKIQGAGYTRMRQMTKAEKELPKEEFKKLEKKLKCFVPCNAKASNDYKDRWAMAYCCNMFFNPNIEGFFTDHNDLRECQGVEPIVPDENKFALSCLIQWMCRGRIRDGRAVSIYIPSERMRNILLNWMNVT